MKFKNFVGGSYYLENIQYDSCRSVNLYPEIDENNTGMDMEFAQLRTPPGKTLALELPTGDSIRGLYTTTKGITYAVSGSVVYQITGVPGSYNYTQIGVLSSDTGPVSMSDNNNVVIFIDNPNGYYYAPGVATSTSINNGGVGYAIGDILTPTVGDQSYQIEVTAINGTLTGTISTAGSGYITGSYTNVPLIAIAGSGSGATANIQISGGGCEYATITNAGSGYTATGYYYNIPLTVLTGSGSGATANIQIGAGAIIDCLISVQGSGFAIGDTLTINNLLIGGAGSGLVLTVLQTTGGVSSISIVSSGSGYTTGEDLTISSSSIGGNGSGFIYTVQTTVGEITEINVLSGGTNYTPGTYSNAPVDYIGVGTGSGATINSTIASNTFQQISDPDWQGANYVTVLDSQFIFTVPDTNIFVYSAPNQLLPFSAGGFDSKSGNSDNINGQFVINRQLWLLGTQTGEIWVDQPTSTQAFQRINGPYLQQGCAALYSTAISETPNGPIGFFISQSPRGGAQVYITNGLSTTKISTQVIDQQLQKYGSNISSATGFTYQYGGHIFYQINPTNDNTSMSSWVYDYTSSLLFGIPIWHERTFANSNGQESRDLANNHCMLSGYHLVGDYSSPNIYYLNDTNATDNGNPIYKTRISPHLVVGFDRVFVDMLQLKCQVGVGNTNNPSSNPQIILSLSADGGETFGFDLPMPLGELRPIRNTYTLVSTR